MLICKYMEEWRERDSQSVCGCVVLDISGLKKKAFTSERFSILQYIQPCWTLGLVVVFEPWRFRSSGPSRCITAKRHFTGHVTIGEM